MDMLALEREPVYDNTITGKEYHYHRPYASSTFRNNDEIRIPVNQQDVMTLPHESMLHISGKLSGKTAGGEAAEVKFVNNGVAFLFDNIRYEIAGNEVDSTRQLGIVSTVKNLLSTPEYSVNNFKNAGWVGPKNYMSPNAQGEFSVLIPLRMLMGFFEDYKRIVVNVKQELVLLRSASDLNAVYSENAVSVELVITDITWMLHHITVDGIHEVSTLKKIQNNIDAHIAYRGWDVSVRPWWASVKQESWVLKTATPEQMPQIIALVFQNDRSNQIKKNASQFDYSSIMDVRVHLNSEFRPYERLRGSKVMAYNKFSEFQQTYYGRDPAPCVDLETFATITPIFVIDCSKYKDTFRSGPVDVRLEIEASENFPPNTTAYCIIFYDKHMGYSLLTGAIKNITGF